MHRFFNNGNHSDMTFMINPLESMLPAHQVLVCLVSLVLEKILTERKAHPVLTVHCHGCGVHIIWRLLSFIYVGDYHCDQLVRHQNHNHLDASSHFVLLYRNFHAR
jgi:BTB/POZ domain